MPTWTVRVYAPSHVPTDVRARTAVSTEQRNGKQGARRQSQLWGKLAVGAGHLAPSGLFLRREGKGSDGARWPLVPARVSVHGSCPSDWTRGPSWAHKHPHRAARSLLRGRGLGTLLDSLPGAPASDRRGSLSPLLGPASLLLALSGPHTVDPVPSAPRALLSPAPSLHCLAKDGQPLYLAPRCLRLGRHIFPCPPHASHSSQGSRAPLGEGGPEEAPWAGSRCCEAARALRPQAGGRQLELFHLKG